MKKLVLLLLAISIMATTFVACGSGSKAPENRDEAPVVDTVAPDEEPVDDDQPADLPLDGSENEVTADEGEEAPEKPSTKPEKPATKPEKPATKPEKPATKPEKPATKPETAPDSKPEAKPEVKEYSLEEVHKIVKNTYGVDYRPDMEIPQESLTDLFGLNLDDIESYIAEQPMMSANIDLFIAIKAKPGKAAQVESALEAYRSNMLTNGMMYPSNMPKAQAGKVIRHGDYVFLVMLGAAGDMQADEATQNAFAKAQVDKGVNAINNYFNK